MRQHPVSQPVPDSAYIVSNVPLARQIQIITAIKAGRTSRTKKAVNQKKKTVNAKKVQLDSRKDYGVC